MNRRREIDFSRWAIAAYNDDTGLGRMAADAKAVLGIGHHLVIPSRRLETGPLGPGDILLDDSAETSFRELAGELDGVLFLENPSWTPWLLPAAKEAGLMTAGVPMWEWFRDTDPNWRLCDLIICPNRKALEVVRSRGFSNTAALPWCLDVSRLPCRRISGPARLFIHNAGLIDHDDRKGTREAVKAFARVKHANARLVVRLQKPAPLPPLDSRVTVRTGNLPDPAALYAEGDAAVQPSKLEGIGFMVLEAVCSGLPVITTRIAPLDEYAIPPELLVRPRWFSRKAFAAQWVPHARLRPADLADLARKIEWCTENDLAGISRCGREWAEDYFELIRLRELWRDTLGSALLGGRSTAAPRLAPL